ncbi:hypothetical protein ACERHZ_06530 [Lactobacillus acidophilus]
MGSLFDPVDEIDEDNSVLTDNQDTYGQAVGEYLEREYYDSLDYE